MMGYGFSNMMGASGGVFGLVGSIVWLVILTDLVLLGIWLWKQISK